MSVLYPPALPVSEKLGHCHEQLPDEYSLDNLVRDIKTYLGSTSGISSSDVDSNYLISLVKKYEAGEGGWTRYYHNDPSKNYTRNAIENINHKANIVSCASLDIPCYTLSSNCSYSTYSSSSYGTPKRAHPSMTTPTPTAS
jgi:hypothetical protein